jgi:hypothetical protein
MKPQSMVKYRYLAIPLTNKNCFHEEIKRDSILGMLKVIQFRIFYLLSKSLRMLLHKTILQLFFVLYEISFTVKKQQDSGHIISDTKSG